MVYLSAIFAVVALFGGALAYAADEAQPGSPLYPYKVAVVERAEELLAFSDTDKATWHLSVMHEELQMAQMMALGGKLDAAGQTEVTNDITAHAREVTALIDNLETKGSAQDAATIAAELYSTLQGEAQSVADTAARGSSGAQIALAPVLVTLRTTLSSVSLISTKAQALAALSKPIGPANTPVTASAQSGL